MEIYEERFSVYSVERERKLMHVLHAHRVMSSRYNYEVFDVFYTIGNSRL